MPIEIEWDDEAKTLIRWKFVGRWSAQDFYDTIQKSNELIGAQDHTVNHIIDFSRSEGIPPNILSDTRYAMEQMPKNIGRVAVITESKGFDVLGEALKRFSWFSNKIHFVKSDAEAKNYFAAR